MCFGFRARTADLLLAVAVALTVAAPASARPVHDAARPVAAPDAAPLPAPPDRLGAAQARADDFGIDRICDLIEIAAARHDLPPSYFARLIWKESRFDVAALSPVGAQGIAQFMPGTARLEGLKNPFDPVQAIPASASHLSDLRSEFGNLGLAAAAYNSGRGRVSRWLAGRGGLPWETRDYVHSITHRPAEWFRRPDRKLEIKPLEQDAPFAAACRKLPIMKTRAVFGTVAATQPWGAQVAGGISAGAAGRAFDRVRARYPTVMGGQAMQLVRNHRAIGARYAAQIGAPSRADAAKVCKRLTRAGGACVVRRN